MLNYTINKKLGIKLVASVSVAATLFGCSGGDESTQASAPSTAGAVESNDQNAATESLQQEYPLEATSSMSGEAGVAMWKLDNQGVAEAFNAEGDSVARFRILENHGGIVNADNPEQKILLNEAGEVVVDTMTEAERGLTEGLREDLRAAAERSAQEAAGEQQPLEWLAFACCNAGTNALLYNWWVGGPTPYCAFRQQSGTCSGITECHAYAAGFGCQYWY